MKREGFVRDVEYIEDDKQGVIRVFLKFGKNGERVITNLKRISKPGLRAYVKADEVPKVLNGLGIAIISTSEGVITDKEAREKISAAKLSLTYGNHSRIYKEVSLSEPYRNKVVVIPEGVTVTGKKENNVTVKGPKGELTRTFFRYQNEYRRKRSDFHSSKRQ